MSRLYTADACAVMKTAVGSLRMRRRRQQPATEAMRRQVLGLRNRYGACLAAWARRAC